MEEDKIDGILVQKNERFSKSAKKYYNLIIDIGTETRSVNVFDEDLVKALASDKYFPVGSQLTLTVQRSGAFINATGIKKLGSEDSPTDTNLTKDLLKDSFVQAFGVAQDLYDLYSAPTEKGSDSRYVVDYVTFFSVVLPLLIKI